MGMKELIFYHKTFGLRPVFYTVSYFCNFLPHSNLTHKVADENYLTALIHFDCMFYLKTAFQTQFSGTLNTLMCSALSYQHPKVGMQFVSITIDMLQIPEKPAIVFLCQKNMRSSRYMYSTLYIYYIECLCIYIYLCMYAAQPPTRQQNVFCQVLKLINVCLEYLVQVLFTMGESTLNFHTTWFLSMKTSVWQGNHFYPHVVWRTFTKTLNNLWNHFKNPNTPSEKFCPYVIYIQIRLLICPNSKKNDN